MKNGMQSTKKTFRTKKKATNRILKTKSHKVRIIFLFKKKMVLLMII